MLKAKLVFKDESKETQMEVIASIIRDIETSKRCYYKVIAQGKDPSGFERDINNQLQWLEDNADPEMLSQILKA